MRPLLKAKYPLLAVVMLFCSSLFLWNCGGSSSETVEVPTLGLITTVQEVSQDEFKIEDEQEVADPADSRIVAKYLNGTVDTFSIDEAKLMAQSNYGGSEGSLFRAASYGFMGYMLGRSMGSHRPSAGAYVDPNTYNRVNNSAGSRVRSTAQSAPKPGSKSGYGSGRSSRSYGG